jgi:putative colanic acid biosynthesis UDP-glucose lipid carrier transferase
MVEYRGLFRVRMSKSFSPSEEAIPTSLSAQGIFANGRIGRLSKRILDCLLALALLLPLALLFIGIAVAIKLDDSGPVFYRQRRHGAGMKPFDMWKFRSMKVQGKDVFAQATKNDSRVTRVGAFLRRTSLDELPQLVNVLRGEMSLVGPRPHAVAMDEDLRRLVANYDQRYRVRPGITGLAQIRGFRGETDAIQKMQDRVDADNEYIDRWSLLLDLRILVLTPIRGFVGPNAY